MASCPICKSPVKPRPENPSVPFCSTRCKTIDLGKWLSEEYRVPVTGGVDEEEVASLEPSQDDPKLLS